MEEKINIAEILKDKPKGIRLYSPIFGECSFQRIQNETDEICVKKHNNLMDLFSSKGLYNILGECLLFPSRHMRDWSKFLWKKGDVLVSNDSDSHIIFNGFSKDDYTTFEGEHWINVSKRRYISYLDVQKTQCYHIEDDKDAAQTYINTVEERLGGKLNLETLEIEKAQPEFKDGDILFTKTNMRHFPSVFILDTNRRDEMRSYVRFIIGRRHIDYGMPVYNLDTNRFRYATEEEKQRLFSALAKENKAWDAEKKQIVDLKLKVELKPFDKVLVRNDNIRKWEADLFGFKNVTGHYHCVGGTWLQCIPYNEETAKLIGTTNNWEG